MLFFEADDQNVFKRSEEFLTENLNTETWSHEKIEAALQWRTACVSLSGMFSGGTTGRVRPAERAQAAQRHLTFSQFLNYILAGSFRRSIPTMGIE